jgi:sirohydrochlorin cobaltochelatase
MKNRGLVLLAHGARDPEWAEPFVRIRAAVAAQRPDVIVELAYLGTMSPRLAAAIDAMAASGVTEVTVAPLLMAQGGHLKEDVPRLLAEAQRRHPRLRLNLLPAVGEVDAILSAMAEWLVGSVPRAGSEEP